MPAILALFSVVPGWVYAAVVAALLATNCASIMRIDAAKLKVAELQIKWDASVLQQRAVALAESEANAKESLRRIEKQKENQNAQNLALAAARSDAVRNDDAASELRQQLAITAQRWRDALDNSATSADSAAAGSAIVLSTQLFSRIDKRAGELAAYADAARIAGEECERNYQALTP